MDCKLCGSKNVYITYQGLIRDGGLGHFTKEPVTMYKSKDCEVIWHDPILSNKEYYESQEYRLSLEGTSEESDFYRLHDKESMDKFLYTGTTIFRNKIVADIGCGCGAFLDYISGVSKKIVAIEPSKKYRDIMEQKGYITFPYASKAKQEWNEKIDVIISFDVIEHVENPREFLEDVYDLLKSDGVAVIGTPTDAPVMRGLLGEIYEKKLLFSTQHVWVLSDKNLKLLSHEVGFSQIETKCFQRYGLENLLGWVRDKEPKSDINNSFISETINSVWKSQLAEKNMADYIVLYLRK